MLLLRKAIFWGHLATGLLAGIVIAILSFTGACLGFEKEIITWAERDVACVSVPAEHAQPLPFDKLLASFRAAQPDARPTTVIFSNDPAAAVQVSSGREGTYYVNPYTGAVSEPTAPNVRAFLRTMKAWHRWLGASEDNRALGRTVTGGANAIFLVLAGSGLYLWWPRSWSRRGLRAIAVVNFKLAGKARDWNWHNAIGVWSAPVLIVVTLSALPMSYRWGNDLIYRATGSAVPGQGGGFGVPVDVPAPTDGARVMAIETLVSSVRRQMPKWETLSVRLDSGGDLVGRHGGAVGGERRAQARPGNRNAAVIIVREHSSWPRTATTTLTLNPYDGSVMRREGFGDQSLGRQIRTWTRFLHTGEALGTFGKAIATLACLGGVILVVTGFSLASRRFFGKRAKPVPAPRETADVLQS